MGKNKVFYGWWVIGVLILTATITSGTGFYCFGVFIEPLMEDFGWSKSQVTWILTIYWISASISAPLVGKLVDVYGIKRVMVVATFCNGICLLALSQVQALWQFYLLYGIKAICHAGIGLIAIGAITSKWFKKKRGRATGIATTGIGFGGLFLAPFAGFLIPIAGWRAVFLVLGIFVFFVALPLVALIIQPTPESMGLLPDGDVQETTAAGKTTPLASGPALNLEIPLPLAVRTPAFWLISFSFMMAGACLFGMLAHQTSYIESIGISRETASLALGFTAGMGILGKILLGFLAERISVRFASLVCFGLQFVGVGILMMTHTMFLVWVYAIVFGFSMGGLVTLRTLIVIDFFGSAAIGAILGITSLIFAMGAAFGPLYAAYVFDFTQSYYWAFLIYMAMYVIAMGMLFTARKVKAGVLPALANPAIRAEKSA